MGPTVERPLTQAEMARMPVARQEMMAAGAQGCATRFTFFAAFDGTFNDEGNLKLSGSPYSTNIAQLRAQAHKESLLNPDLQYGYYPGVGTGGDQGGTLHAGVLPTPAIEAAANKAYADFRPLYYSSDPRVTHVEHPGNHVGNGGGYDAHGTAASVLEGVSGYFRQRGVAIAEVPPERRHDPQAPQLLYTEVWQSPRSGELPEDGIGQRPMSWAHDRPQQGRVKAFPRMSPEHMDWLRQAFEELSPGLKAWGLDAQRCLQVAAACVCATARRQAQLGPPREFMLSGDGQSVGVMHEVGVLREVSVPQALQTPTLEHLHTLQREQQPAREVEAGRSWQHEHAAPVLKR